MMTNKKMFMKILGLFFIMVLTVSSFADESEWAGTIPKVADIYGFMPQQFQQYDVILEPDRNEPEWWAGAPSVLRDGNGIFWLACRMRSPEFPRGLRGYEIRILTSKDGIHFTRVHSILREKVPIPGFERPCLVIDPKTKLYKLYGCGPWQDGPWSIIKFADAVLPGQFEPASAKPVIQPRAKQYERDQIVDGYKDPFIFYTGDLYHCYVIGYLRRFERIYHFTSADGDNWQAVGHANEAVMNLHGWHDFFVRPASVVPLGVGYLFFYEGSKTTWYDPVYNVTTGVGFTFDLHNIIDLTPNSPLVVSSTPGQFHTWRYSHWMMVDGELWVYAEVARENDSNEIRLFRVKIK